MPLFECSKCHYVENTATSNYWIKVARDGQEPLCSVCDPDIGKWHGEFERFPAKGMLIDQDGHLWSKSTVEAGQLPKSYKIIGEVK